MTPKRTPFVGPWTSELAAKRRKSRKGCGNTAVSCALGAFSRLRLRASVWSTRSLLPLSDDPCLTTAPEDWRSPRRCRVFPRAGERAASWTAVVLYRFPASPSSVMPRPRAAFGVRGACTRFGGLGTVGQRQPVLRSSTAEGGQAGRTPYAARYSPPPCQAERGCPQPQQPPRITRPRANPNALRLKRQRTGAVQDANATSRAPENAQRLGLR